MTVPLVELALVDEVEDVELAVDEAVELAVDDAVELAVVDAVELAVDDAVELAGSDGRTEGEERRPDEAPWDVVLAHEASLAAVRVSKSSAEQRINEGSAAGHDGLRPPRLRALASSAPKGAASVAPPLDRGAAVPS
jgi:hypothetical protein